jgi:conjugative transfer signal peptidase TraF
MQQILERLKHPNRRRLFEVLAVAAGVLFCLALIGSQPLGINPTPSMPLGLYELLRLDHPIHRGDIVQLCPPEQMALVARERNYVPLGACVYRTAPFIKYVAAVPGDVVDLRDGGVWVNGHRLDGSAPVAWDDQHRALPKAARGRYRLRPGQIWVWSPYPRSLDSRYYGPIAVSSVKYFAKLALQVQAWPWSAGLASLPR